MSAQHRQLSRLRLFAYAAFALPLAMAALPVYVHLPKFYAGDLGVPLAAVGGILLAARLLDALQDPLLGYASDRTSAGVLGRRLLILLALPFLGGGILALFHPPEAAGAGLQIWLAASLVLVHLGLSAGAIAYYAMGAELSSDYDERTRVTATRAAMGLAGVLIAAAAPQALFARLGVEQGLAWYSWLFVPVLLACAALSLRFSPKPARKPVRLGPDASLYANVVAPLQSVPYRWLIAVSILSGVSAAIPATLLLFYVQDVLQRPALAGVFLAIYFVLGAAGMPLWVSCARRLGKKQAWLMAMLLSVIAFAWAFLLGAGDAIAFAAVCAASGLAYGAELALPPSMLADIVDGDERATTARRDGAYFGLWQMVEKLNLALAAGLALPMLQWLGYVPGSSQPAQTTLSLMYALVPCAIKLAAVACLWVAPLDARPMRPAGSGGMA